MTKYVVLRQPANVDTDTWYVVDTVEASGSEQAIRKTVLDSTGTYVAVPVRSWQPQKVSVKQREPLITIVPA